MRVAALREPNPTWNPVRLPTAIFQPVEDDREYGLRTKLAGMENEEFIENLGGERKLRKSSRVRAFRVRAFRVRAFRVRVFREFEECGGGHSEAKTVSV